MTDEFADLKKKYGLEDETEKNTPKSNVPDTPGQRQIDAVFEKAFEEYEEIRAITDENEKSIQMDIFFINYLKPFYDALAFSDGIKTISVERFGRTDGIAGHWYVPMFVDKNGISKMANRPFPYKATALMKLMASFTTKAGPERIF